LVAEPLDVVVIGAGMGGSIVAARCGEAGLRTLVLEKGGDPQHGGPKAPLMQRVLGMQKDHSGERWPDALLVRSGKGKAAREVKAILGIGPGGSGRIYGAALGRGLRADFEQDFQPYSWGQEGTALRNDWPVAYDDFLNAYRDAETMLGIVGTHDPLDPDDDAPLNPAPDISPAHKALMEQLAKNGRHPFRMHTGIGYKPGCSECQGNTCERDCKAHGFNRALIPAMQQQAPITLLKNAQVKKFERTPNTDGTSQHWSITFSTPDNGEEQVFARNLVVAAGALNTPRILRAMPHIWDGDVPHLIGRGLMLHGHEVFAVWPPEHADLYGPRKVIAYRDHYLDGAAPHTMPLAETQSLGMVSNPGIISNFIYDAMRKAGLGFGNVGRIPARIGGEIGQKLFEGAELFWGAMQDLPYEDNCVTTEIDANGVERIAITYHSRPEFIERVKHFRALTKQAFAPLKVRFTGPVGEMNFGHPMGTCRMSHAPDHGVLDANGQVWGQDGLYVADASAFASGMGINPALTTAAHAIRVAQVITAQSSAK